MDFQELWLLTVVRGLDFFFLPLYIVLERVDGGFDCLEQ